MADKANYVEKITTGHLLSFINGALVPAGTPVTINAAKVDLEGGNTENLADLGDYTPVSETAVEVAAIGPTGPKPTMPQQVPPGAFQTPQGYVIGGVLYVAEGSAAAAEADPNAKPAGEAEVEEEGSTSATGEFNATAIIDGNLDTAKARLAGLSNDQLDAVEAAENAKGDKARAGLIEAVAAAKAANG